jgi:hypothetical protein
VRFIFLISSSMEQASFRLQIVVNRDGFYSSN